MVTDQSVTEIRSISGRDSPAFAALLQHSAKTFAMPYGQNLSDNFLRRRLQSSETFDTDYSLMLHNREGLPEAALVANLKQYPGDTRTNTLWLNHLTFRQGTTGLQSAIALVQALRQQAATQHLDWIKTSLQWGGVWPGILVTDRQSLQVVAETGGALTSGEVFLSAPITGVIANSRFAKDDAYRVRAYRASDSTALLALSGTFGVGWLHETMSKVDDRFEPFNGYGLSTTYEPKDLFVVTHKGRLIGFCVVQTGTCDTSCFFGPIGLELEYRRAGIGTLLLNSVMKDMHRRDNETVGLWTSRSLFDGFYRRFGFSLSAETYHANWVV